MTETKSAATRITELKGEVAELREQLHTVAWLHSELSYALKAAIAQAMTQQAMPMVQQMIMEKLTSGAIQ